MQTCTTTLQFHYVVRWPLSASSCANRSANKWRIHLIPKENSRGALETPNMHHLFIYGLKRICRYAKALFQIFLGVCKASAHANSVIYPWLHHKQMCTTHNFGCTQSLNFNMMWARLWSSARYDAPEAIVWSWRCHVQGKATESHTVWLILQQHWVQFVTLCNNLQLLRSLSSLEI